MKKRVLGLISILALSGFTALSLSQRGPIQAQSTTPTPTATPLPRVGALGRLQPAGRVVTVGGPTGERIGALLRQEGEEVQKGDVIARLDNYEERLAERDYAASQLAEAQAQLSANVALGRVQVDEARTRLQQVDQPRQREISAQEAIVRQWQAEFEDARTNRQRFETLFQQGAVSQQDLDQRRLAVEQKSEALKSAQATLEQLRATRSTDVSNANSQVKVAAANLTSVQNQTPIQSLTTNLRLANARLERTLIRAPQDGQILKIRRYPGEVIDSEGIVQLGDTRRMYVVAEIYETDIPKIRLGQRATITSLAFPATIQGDVDFIGLQIGKKDVLSTNPAEDVDARVVEIKIRVRPEDNALVAGLTNMQVTVTIELQPG